MSNNQNTGQFMVKQQIGKHSTEGGSFPPRYQAPPLPLSDVLKSANVNFPTRDYKGAYNARVPSDQLKHGYPGPISASVPANLQYNAALQQPFSKHGHNGYPASVSGHRQYRLSDDNLSKVGAHQEAPQRARSVEDEILRAPQQLLKGRPTDEELLRRGPADMLKFVKRLEGETARSTNEQQRQIQTLIDEIKALKEANRRLNEDNRELRDLCCFLDDDRQKGRKLAREWQRFGRYTASVMRQEVSAYQSKLRELDDKQQELIKDNLELKELCLYLDEERGASRNGGGGLRDDGDGSSSSTNADDPLPRRAAFDDRTVRYVRDLEARVERLEEEKRALLDGGGIGASEGIPGPGSARPEAVVRALQVLEVRERARADLDAGEKALVREMCNVVWRKLEEAPPDDRC